MPNPPSDDGHVKPPWWLKPMNKVFMAMMKLGLTSFGGDGPLVLTVPGRTSGQPRSTPITPMHANGQRYVVAGFPNADWVKNARGGPSAAAAVP